MLILLQNHHNVLKLADQFAADGQLTFTFEDTVERTGLSRPATANQLRRMAANGLVDKVHRGHYVTRQLGVLGTTAVAEDVPSRSVLPSAVRNTISPIGQP